MTYDSTRTTEEQSDEGYLPQAKISTWTYFFTCKSYKQTVQKKNNTIQNDIDISYTGKNRIIGKRQKLYICNNNMITWEHPGEIKSLPKMPGSS